MVSPGTNLSPSVRGSSKHSYLENFPQTGSVERSYSLCDSFLLRKDSQAEIRLLMWLKCGRDDNIIPRW